MNFFQWLYWRIRLSGLQKRQLKYMADRFDEWHKSTYPELSVEAALEKYEGITTQELLENVK